MARKITGFCVALLLILTSASAARRRLNSISELTDFHQNDHTNILQLLHWFANTVSIDGNVIRLTFDPNSGDFGSHYYGNFESLLDPLPWGHKYYTVGNVHQTTSRPLPHYVVNSQRRTDGWNRARIIIRVRGGNTGLQNQIIERVFITQHYATSDGQGTNYNPEHTYEVSASLLRDIRRRNVDEIQRLAESSWRGNFGSTTHLQGRSFYNQYNYTPQANIRPASSDDRLKTFFIAILLIICVFFFMPFIKRYLGNMKK